MTSLTLFILTMVTVVTSAISAILGMAGGILLLAVMTSFIEDGYVVPLYSSVQLISNVTRLLLFFRHIHWRILLLFALGLVPGALLGIRFVHMLAPDTARLVLGAFILASVLVPKSKNEVHAGLKIFVPVGFAVGAVGVLIGSPGPILAPFFLRNDILKERLIATKAACQALLHLTNVLLYGSIGVNVLAHGHGIFLLGAASILGTLLGKKLLAKIPDRGFLIAAKVCLLLIAVRIITLQILKWS